MFARDAAKHRITRPTWRQSVQSTHDCQSLNHIGGVREGTVAKRGSGFALTPLPQDNNGSHAHFGERMSQSVDEAFGVAQGVPPAREIRATGRTSCLPVHNTRETIRAELYHHGWPSSLKRRVAPVKLFERLVHKLSANNWHAASGIESHTCRGLSPRPAMPDIRLSAINTVESAVGLTVFMEPN